MSEFSDHAIPLAAARLDHARCVVAVNGPWAESFGLPASELVGRKFDTLLAPRDAAGRRAYLHALSTQTTGTFGFYARIASRGEPILSYVRFCGEADGWFVMAEAVKRDEINGQLLFERERWRSVLRGSADGIAVLDDEGRFVEVNAAFLQLVAPRVPDAALLDEHGIVGWHFSEVVPPRLSEVVVPSLMAPPARGSVLHRVALGATHIEVCFTPMRSAGGVIAGTCLALHDRTADHLLEQVNRQLAAHLELLQELYRVLPGILLVVEADGRIASVNAEGCAVLGYAHDELIGRPISLVVQSVTGTAFHDEAMRGDISDERALVSRSGEAIPVLMSAALCGGRAPAESNAAVERERGRLVCVALDLRERQRLEQERRQSAKLESVGRLAAGIAHEINTPVQYVSDSLHFLRDGSHDLMAAVEALGSLRRSVVAREPWEVAAARAEQAEQDADLPYLVENLPRAFERCMGGLERVATIVRSMKEFAHPDSKEMTATDLNRAIESTLVIAHAEYKFCADVHTDFGEIPVVRCHPGDVNQAVLNIVVNAAHAISDAIAGTDQRGTISVKTRLDGGDVVISIADTGGGIPPAVGEKMFDPFFTTKEVGRGTGQGLAISRSVIVSRHGGSLTYESELGSGTVFHLRLPVGGPPAPRTAALPGAAA